MMKHNLKTIKLKIRAYNRGLETTTIQDITNELEGFEKELRDRLKKLEEIPKENQIWKVSYPLQMTIKEILGET